MAQSPTDDPQPWNQSASNDTDTKPLPVTSPTMADSPPPHTHSEADTNSQHWMWSREGHRTNLEERGIQAPTDHSLLPPPAHTESSLSYEGNFAEHEASRRTPPTRLQGQGKVKRVAAKVAGGVMGLALAMVAGVAGGAGFMYYADRHHVTSTIEPQNVEDSAVRRSLPVASNERNLSIAEVATKVQPSVVQIELNEQQGHVTGSGVILTAEGRILTNNHVVEDAALPDSEVLVHLHDGRVIPAKVVATDPDTDLAVIQLTESSNLTAAQLGSSEDLSVGEEVVAIGSPMGLEGTVTRGIVSALHRPVAAGGNERRGRTSALEAIQTDASINPGNSGGALVNLRGEVVGINFMIFTLGEAPGQSGSIGLGFAIPIDMAQRIADQLVHQGKVAHASLGVSVRETSPRAKIRGASVISVNSGSGADNAGIDVGSIITKVNGRPIDSTVALVAAIRSFEPGDNVHLSFYAHNTDVDERTVTVVLGMV